jgi:L-2-hydroxyglutarate oxidase LhgO
MLKESTGAIVIGAGVIGLACARALASRGIETIIVENHNGIGQETSSRNSEVIHAGLYYPANSLKASLCVQGKHQLYEYCAARSVPHRRCGKLIVATSTGHEETLEKLLHQAALNGVDDILPITRVQALRYEPDLYCTAALYSPSTGIIDSHALMLSLLGDAEDYGAALALNTRVDDGSVTATGVELLITGSDEPILLSAQFVVNAAGLHAPSIARRLAGFPTEHIPRTCFAKGNYYALSGRAPFSTLIYPVPEEGGLGVHLTLDLSGQVRFGPDVEWTDTLEYSVDPRRCNSFYAEVRKYWPQLPDDSLTPAYAGIRPKLSGSGEPNADFLIQGPETHGIAGLVNLFGIESPGLTSCLAIAEHACARLGLPASTA